MNNTFLGTDPAELGVVDEMAPCFTPILDEGFESVALDAFCQVGDGCADNLITTANCECLINR